MTDTIAALNTENQSSALKAVQESTSALSGLDVSKGIEQEIEQASAIYQMVVEFFVNYSFQIIGALIVMCIGVFVARKLSNLVEKICEKKGIDVTLRGFIAASVRLLIITMVGIIALGKLGISVTPFLAAIGALSLGAGLALQGLLSNYGAGFNIILTRPFVVGDTIEVQGVSGLVKSVQLAYTSLIDEDGTEITIPNKHITGEIIHNSYSSTLSEITIGIAYSENTDRAISIIRSAIENLPCLNSNMRNTDNAQEQQSHNTTQVGIDSFGDSSVNIAIRAWLPTDCYHQQRFELNALIYKALNEAGVDIPFPQREVRVLDNQ